MSYPDDSVGALMDFEMVAVRDDVSLEVVLRYLRRLDELPDHTDQVFVVGRDEVLKGTLPINRLLVTNADVMVPEVMSSDMLTLNPWDKAGDAAQAFERYDLVSAPVVDAENRLVGRVTVNEVMDYIRDAQEEEMLSKAGLSEEEDIFAPISRSVKNRAPWLMLNLCTASTAAYVASRFESTVSHIVILAFLMSIVAGIGGNSGNQTMTLIIRALALGQITSANVRRLATKELATSFLIGIGGGLIAATFATFISHRVSLGAVMMAAMMLNLLVGSTVGMLVPLARYRMGRDPAVGSSVLLTFATDTMGFFIFLGLATLFLL
jgi:magnesium transporter